ncbi:Gp138 family membrane-puncturing spike protein [Lysinibacillus sp. NPDC097162]|uniref:Gp138 family membrane-puncturing spike protein n=1 Tax=Lysinibacillus sp. NPDC097162 TaxID=3364140 RepID=UPI0038063939
MTKTSITQFVSENIQESLENINTCLICEILEVDMNSLKADVQPLNDSEATPILDVPIAFHQTEQFIIQVPYKKGDTVLVACSQADIDPLMFGGGDAASRAFSANDALIIGGINYFTKPIQNEHPDDLVIGTKDFTTKIVINEAGEVSIKSSKFKVEADDIELIGKTITANGEDLTVDLV